MKSAFTKKDLAVVLGCIVFMLATVGAIGHSGRSRAKETLCLAQMKQWALSFRLYAEDNKGYFPYPSLGAITYPYSYAHGWWPVMRPYFTDYNMLLCPMATKTSSEGARQPYAARTYGSVSPCEIQYVPPSWGDSWRYSYAVNAWMFSFEGNMGSRFGNELAGEEKWRWKRMDSIKGAGSIPLFGDSALGGSRARDSDLPAQYENVFDWVSSLGQRCIKRHNCGVNCAFADGSAKKVGLKQLWRLKWHRQFDTTKGPVDGLSYPAGWPDWMKDCPSYPSQP